MKVDLGVITVDEFQIKAPVYPRGRADDPALGYSREHPRRHDRGRQRQHLAERLRGRVRSDAGAAEPARSRPRSASSRSPGHASRRNQPRRSSSAWRSISRRRSSSALPASASSDSSACSRMHYGRNLPTVSPDDVIGPDLQWLINAGGQPQQRSVQRKLCDTELGAADRQLGVRRRRAARHRRRVSAHAARHVHPGIARARKSSSPSMCRCSPICPASGDDGSRYRQPPMQACSASSISTSTLGQITLGVISINLEVEELISISVPISIFFSWDDPDTWHVWLGTIKHADQRQHSRHRRGLRLFHDWRPGIYAVPAQHDASACRAWPSPSGSPPRSSGAARTSTSISRSWSAPISASPSRRICSSPATFICRASSNC